MNSSSLFSFILSRRVRRRSGVSPVIATTILLGITVALGLALWSFANSSVGAATQDYAETVTEYGRFTSDRFVVPSVAYDHPNADDITIFVYNSGRFDTTIDSVIVTCWNCPAFSPTTLDASMWLDDGHGSLTIPSKTLRHLHFDSSAAGTVFQPGLGYTYQVQVISDTGAYQTTYQEYE